ncbi:hypothetical protein BDV59DRAFT_195802 [Aspergillus ambiguus]|uniref:LipA and NB-ARC domain protein n=1 Tax=Aspergillus ambiguus TaxID=176160 RepID=UPI003CCC8F5E
MSSEETEVSSKQYHSDIVLGAPISAKWVLGSLMSTSTSTPAKWWKRIVSYALVELYPRNTSTAPLVAQLKAQLGDIDIRQDQIYRLRKLGYRWKAIVSWASRESDQPLTGILFVLDNTSRWERSTAKIWQAAFDALPNKSGILRRAQDKNKDANYMINNLKKFFNFVNCPPHTEGNEVVLSQGIRSVAVVSEVISDPTTTGSADAEPLIILLSFLADHEVSADLLCRGASPRKRWTDDGEISEMGPAELGLSDELIRICSPNTLTRTLSELQSAIVWTSTSRFKLSQRERGKILKRLSPSNSFWCLQALIVACRSVPWKYLEHMESDIILLKSHVRYALEGAHGCCKLEDINPMVRTDIALNLMESSRFYPMEWKRFAINRAKELTIGLHDSYTSSHLAQRQCLLHRLSGDTDLAFSVLVNDLPHHANRRLHATYGHTIIQRALNYIQLDQLDKATASLAAWQPTSQSPSAIEQVVLFRQHLIMGKILRYQGHFMASLQHLQKSRNITATAKDLNFLEDASDLACNLADTYLELDDPAEAESCLRAAIERQAPKQGALIISLAECLFAQKRFADVDATLRRVSQWQLKLMKMDKLRLAIVQAKLSHVRSQFEEAFGYWTEAMSNLRRFTLASGRTTRIILLSHCHVLHAQGFFDIENRTRDQLDALEECADKSGALYWISGLRHWLHYLESCNQA